MADDDLLSRKQAAHYLRKKGCATSATTLANLAANANQGKGPPFLVYRSKGRRFVSYKIVDLDAWAEKRIRRVE